MSAWPAWDAAVNWSPGGGPATDRASGREAYRGPLGEGGTPDQSTADGAWGSGNFGGWTQPDGRVVFYQPQNGILEALAAGIGAPVSLGVGTVLALWAQSEGVPAEAHNPMATLRTGYGETYRPPWTAPFYPHLYAGQRAFVDTLTSGGAGYDGILRALRGDEGIVVTFNAVNESAWCRGCQGGNYPVDLYNAMVAIGGATAGGTTASGAPAPGTTPTFTPAQPVPLAGLDGIPEAWSELADSVNRHVPNAVADLIGVQNRGPLGP